LADKIIGKHLMINFLLFLAGGAFKFAHMLFGKANLLKKAAI